MRYSKPTMRKTCIILTALIMFNGCDSKKSEENWDEKNTRYVAVEDTIYLNAISLAKQNLHVFIDSLENQRSNNYDFYIKSKYSDGKNTEHLWFIVETFKEKTFVGILDNAPLNLKNIKLADKLDIKIEEVEDWIIYKDDTIIAGNYLAKTIK